MLVGRGVYVEDAAGGYWTLASGAPLRDAAGAVIARALQLEWKTGDSREFNLRNYAIDVDHLDEVGSTDASTYRVEMLTPAQFHFATSLAGIDFRPETLTARLDAATGHLAYAVGPTGRANLSADPAASMSGINAMTTSRCDTVRLAMPGGLKDAFDGIAYVIALGQRGIRRAA